MKKLMVLLVMTFSISALFLANCGSSKNSTEACVHETVMNLDKGNYDAVLASSCADAMQLGAAWFGKAGYDIKDVLNRFIDANADTGSSSSTQSDLNVYMTSLTGDVQGSTITNLDNARNEYVKVTAVDEGYQDAQFYIGIVDAMKGLSVIKLVIQDGNGLIDSTCNLNGNSNSDGIDATVCALKVSYNQTCDSIATFPTMTYTTVPNISIIKLDGTTSYGINFTALNISTAPTGSASCGQYTKILYPDAASPSGLSLATTTQDKCTGSPTNPFDPQGLWPCPIEDSNYLNFVTAVDSSITTAITSIDSSLVSSSTNSTPDIQQSINDIKSENCCTDPGEVWNPDSPGSCTCSSAEMATYLQTI